MKTLLLLIALTVLIVSGNAQGYDDPEKLVVALYDEVTFDQGETPDWALVKTMFLEQAVVVLRYGPDNMTVFDLQGWVDDFITFIKDDKVDQTGFHEEILGMNSYVYGDIASINVLFDSRIPGTDRRNQGVDIFQLIKKDGVWKIVSIVNERPAFGGVVPDIY
jgi:hypothetical protein